MPQPTKELTHPRHWARLRLLAQGLSAQRWATAADAARAFGVMQGQDVASVQRQLRDVYGA